MAQNFLKNGSVPACLLPAEILSSTFTNLAQSSTPREVVDITHVCQCWREAALGCASLWATVPFINHTFTKVALERSRSLPLSVRLGEGAGVEDFGSCGELLRQAFSGPRQLKSISISRPVFISNPTTTRPPLQTILSNFTDIAPLLETVYVDCSNIKMCPIPDDFLCGDTPFLRSLGLVGCDILWRNIPFASSLTHLRLSQDYAPRDGSRPSVRELVDTLKGTPSLVELELRRYLPDPDSSSTSSADSPVVTLHSLTQLTLEDSVDSVIIFTSIVRIPKVTSLTLSDFGPCWEFRDTNGLRHTLTALERTWRDDHLDYQPLQQAPRKLEIDGRESVQLAAIFRIHFAEHAAVNQVAPTLNLSFGDAGLELSGWLSGIGRELDLSSLVSLTVEDVALDGLEPADWESAFSQCPHLRQITFKDCYREVEAFIEAAQRRAAQSTPPGGSCSAHSHNLWPPALRRIQFINAGFRRRKVGSPASVVHFIRHHATNGKNLDVEVKECSNFHPEDYRRLADIAGVNVDWDWDDLEERPGTDTESESEGELEEGELEEEGEDGDSDWMD